MTFWTSKRVAGEPPRIDGIAFDSKSGGEESLLVVWSETRIVCQFGVLRNPQRFVGREDMPTVWTSDRFLQSDFDSGRWLSHDSNPHRVIGSSACRNKLDASIWLGARWTANRRVEKHLFCFPVWSFESITRRRTRRRVHLLLAVSISVRTKNSTAHGDAPPSCLPISPRFR